MVAEQLKSLVKGDVLSDEETLSAFSRDASLFELRPQVVVAPKDSEDIARLVNYVSEHSGSSSHLSLTVRSGGTDMTGGPLSDSIVLDMSRSFNQILEVNSEYARTQPGVFYRDFERETLRRDRLMPSYPASKDICTVGGMVANNSGGEKTLAYGKTEDYVMELKAVLADGKEYVFAPLKKQDLEMKMKLDTFEGQIYKKLYTLLEENKELIEQAKPQVSKNSAGYFLWNVWDGESFDLTKLLTGSQGTLGIITEIQFRLIQPKKLSKMLVIFMKEKDMVNLGNIAAALAVLKPETFESYDDNTFKLGIKFFPQMLKILKPKNIFTMLWHLLPELWMLITGGVPKLVLMAEFTSNDEDELEKQLLKAQEAIKPFALKSRITRSEEEENEFWVIRRQSFNLLRNKIKGKQTAPFIDDIIVRPEFLPEFLPKLNALIARYKDYLVYTVAGHVGDGNFHIIPLMDLSDPAARAVIPKLSDEVYDLVNAFHGSITAEHNDGLIRTPYLEKMYGEKVYQLFEEVKKIFDPQNIFNPGKKVGANKAFAMAHIRKS
ncbi:MAG: FAD-binding oxidoreductase [Candidatus Harrisonbacteria bacterium]|nr:FAD-binding oxidoreductase [Candidatus Harrisonbacteria bacterium]